MSDKPRVSGTWETQMTPEAIAKRDEIVSSWELPYQPQSKPEEAKPMYIGQKTKSNEIAYSEAPMSLADFCSEVEKIGLVDSVYCLEDAREDEEAEEPFVHLFVKLKPLHIFTGNYIDLTNGVLTKFLSSRRIIGTTSIRVSYQYTEVYK